MKIGTRSLLFGAHQFVIHPLFVAWAWWKLYGFPRDPRLWIAFLIHDWGYWGKPNMDGPEGEKHPQLGASIMHRLFDRPFSHKWFSFCRYHSRFLAKKDGQPYSRLCVADKFAIALQPWWCYLPMVWLTGELKEYMIGKATRISAEERSPRQWYLTLQRYYRSWVIKHRHGVDGIW